MKKVIFLGILFFAFEGPTHVTETVDLDKICRERDEIWQMRECVRRERDECFFELQICCQYEMLNCRKCMENYDDCVWSKAQASACVPESKKSKNKQSQ